MEWLKEFIKGLPLDKISETVGDLVAWWSEQVKDIPADELPFQVYVGASLIVCALWFFVARMLPRPFGGMSWMVVIATLLTPGVSLGETGDIAPACVSVAYAILMKDFPAAAHNFLPILMVIVGGFLLGFVWQSLKDLIAKERQKSIAKKEGESVEKQAIEASIQETAKQETSTQEIVGQETVAEVMEAKVKAPSLTEKLKSLTSSFNKKQ